MTTQALDLTQIAVAIVALILTIIARYVIPYVKAKISAEDTKKLCVWTEVAVKAAEQLCKSGAIEKEARKEHVIKFLAKKGLTVDIDEVEELIESFVHQLPSLVTKKEDEEVTETSDNPEKPE